MKFGYNSLPYLVPLIGIKYSCKIYLSFWLQKKHWVHIPTHLKLKKANTGTFKIVI